VRAAQRNTSLYVLAREKDDECGERSQDDRGRYKRLSAFRSQLKIEN
jgi:hypothetical protein